jgi:hypothetical protein
MRALAGEKLLLIILCFLDQYRIFPSIKYFSNLDSVLYNKTDR